MIFYYWEYDINKLTCININIERCKIYTIHIYINMFSSYPVNFTTDS